MTIDSGVAALERVESDDLGEVMNLASRGMLLGARGNSGVILSQFFAGVASGFEHSDKADPAAVGRALERGVEQAYASVMTPTEGTILTVAREAVEYAVSRITDRSTVSSLFSDLVREMKRSVKRTPERLAALREAGVVDSGGAGLFYIMDGINRVLNGEKIETEPTRVENLRKNASFTATFNADSEMPYGYCTELLVQLMRRKCDIDNFDVASLKDYLAQLGDSLHVVIERNLGIDPTKRRADAAKVAVRDAHVPLANVRQPFLARRVPYARRPPHLSVAYMMAFMLCMRFSASSNTTERDDSNTSSVTSISSMPNFLAISAPMVVLVSWKLGRQCMKMASSAAASITAPFTW
jgi:hypothetical protein